ncbi:MAG TPA: hypothetical protein VFD58_08100 [Blastocatellia bacterium]|nr:hypothetical protein [Blastocatellia bacterium]
MAHRLAAFFLTILFTGHALAGGMVCGAGNHQPADETACCCTQSDSVAASPAAKLCCESRCGKPVNDGQQAPQEHAQLPSSSLNIGCHPSLNYAAATADDVLVKSAEALLLERHPPPLFLSCSSLLI